MNTTFRAGWLTVAALFAASWLSAQNPSSEDLLRADKQFDLYAYNLALRTYEQVLQKDPKNAHAMARMGDCYFQLNRPEEALPHYDRAVRQPNVEPDVLLRYGKALMHTGDYVGAKKWFLEYAEGNQYVGQHFADMCNYAIQTSQKDALYVARNEPLNTEASDYCPSFLANRVVYNSARNDIARKMQSKSSSDWTGSAYNQLFVTQRNAEAGFLQKPTFLRSDLQNSYNEGPASFSGDGKQVAFCRNNFIDGTRQIAEKGLNMSLYTADIGENGSWTNIKPFPYNGSDFATGFPALSPDGNTLIFASNQDDGFGSWDLYVSNKTASGWSTPRNLGAPLNTQGNEVTPFYDGKNLFFSSDWHPGLGGLDIFRAELGSEAITNIYHLGPGINSSRDDYGMIYNADQNIGYITSNRSGGRGNEDIWQVTKKWPDPQPGTSVMAGSNNPAPQTYSTEKTAAPQTYSTQTTPTYVAGAPANFLYLLVTDEQSNPLPNTEVDFQDCAAGTGRTDANGKFFFEPLSRPIDCRVNLSRDGYQEASVSLYSFGKQNVIVAMSRDKRVEFIGKVMDARTKDPLYSVVVQFLAPGSDRLIQTSTDYDGRYSIFVEPGISYDFGYTKEGYVEATVKTRPVSSSGNRIPDVLLDRPYSKSSYTSSSGNGNYNTPTETAPVEYYTASSVKPISLYTPVAQPEPSAPLTGYSIQLAASPENLTEGKLRKYEDLSEHGNLYVKTEAGIQKVRLGIFSTKEEAQKKLKALHKNGAYKDAFVVEERGGDESLVVGAPANVRPAEYNTASSATAKGVTNNIRYAVQLGSFVAEKAINISDYTGVASLGNVYTKIENSLTKVRLGVWADHADAEAAQNVAVERGFRDAIVVTEKADDASIKGFLLPAIGAPAPSQYSNTGLKQSKMAAQNNKGDVARPVQYSTATQLKAPTPYYIKIAALSNPDRFDATPLADVGGKIETRKAENGMTIILLGGFTDLESATLVQNRVRNKGYEGTYVIKDDKGKLMKQ